MKPLSWYRDSKQLGCEVIEWRPHYGDVGKTQPKKNLIDPHKPFDAVPMNGDTPH
jgi:hypothetical protein